MERDGEKRRYVKITLQTEVIQFVGDSDEQLLKHAQDLGDLAVDGMMNQYPDLNVVSQSQTLTEMNEGRALGSDSPT